MRTIFAFAMLFCASNASYSYAEHVVIEERPVIEEKVHVPAPVVVEEEYPHHHHHHVEVEEKVEVRV